MLKLMIIVLQLALLTGVSGCGTSQKKTLFGKEEDILTKSPCESCREKPFYVNGRWI